MFKIIKGQALAEKIKNNIVKEIVKTGNVKSTQTTQHRENFLLQEYDPPTLGLQALSPLLVFFYSYCLLLL